MTKSARTPGSAAKGALWGSYPEVALGLPPSVGVAYWDDFVRLGASGYGDLDWEIYNSAAITTATRQTPSAESEIGIYHFDQTNSNRTHILNLGFAASRPYFTLPPVGTIWAIKIKHASLTSGQTLFAGFLEATIAPLTANNVDFVGIRNEALTVGPVSWFGVCKEGAGSGNEQTIDLGVLGSISLWNVFGFEILPEGIQFFQLNLSNPGRVGRTNIGNPLTLHFPSAPMTPVFGFSTHTAGNRGFDIDWIGWGGRFRRKV